MYRQINSLSVMIYGIFIFTLALLWSCKEDSVDREITELSGIENSDWTAPVLIDTLSYNTETKQKLERAFSNYSPLYLGSLKDTLFVDYGFCSAQRVPPPPTSKGRPNNIEGEIDSQYFLIMRTYDEIEPPSNSPYFKVESPENPAYWEDTELEIVIDTNRIIKNLDFNDFRDSVFAFNAYPVYIINNTDKFSQIGRDCDISMVLEKMDDNGDWVEQDKRFPLFCDTDVPHIVLPPGHIALTSVKIFQTADEAKYRLRLGDNTSTEFSVIE
jgi:hypothetical protein